MKKELFSAELVGAVVAVIMDGQSMEKRVECMMDIAQACHDLQSACEEIAEKYDAPILAIQHIATAALVDVIRECVDEDVLNDMVGELPIKKMNEKQINTAVKKVKQNSVNFN